MNYKIKWLIAQFHTTGLIALLCLLLPTCKKDYNDKKYTDCENFAPSNGFGVGTIKQMSSQKHAPCFNPNNLEEFVYVKEENNNYKLVKYDIQSKLETVLLDNTIVVGQPKWGRNGWIVFSGIDLNVYLIKSNGDSLRKITTYFENNHPSFLGFDKIFASVGSETSTGASGNKIIDYSGKRVDSLLLTELEGLIWLNHVNSLNEVCGSFKKDNKIMIKILKYPNKTSSDYICKEFNGRIELTGIFWHPNNDDIYYSTYREGIFVLNKSSKNVTKIKCGCDSRSYRYLSISPDGNNIIAERVDATDYNIANGSWTEEGKIVIMDIDGRNERNVFE